MLLAIDIGNTNIVYGVFYKDKLISEFRTQSNSKDLHLISSNIKNNITDIIISSVVPNLTSQCLKICKNKYRIDGFIVKYNNVPDIILNASIKIRKAFLRDIIIKMVKFLMNLV